MGIDDEENWDTDVPVSRKIPAADWWDEQPKQTDVSARPYSFGSSNTGSSFHEKDDNRYRRGRGNYSNRGRANENGGRGRANDRKFADRAGESNSLSESEKMVVPKSVIGALIGKGGSKIKEMEAQSGAKIKIEEIDGEGVVHITGDSGVRSKAKQLVEQTVSSSSRESRSGNQRFYSNNERGAFNGFNNRAHTEPSSRSFSSGFGSAQGTGQGDVPRTIDWNAVYATDIKFSTEKWKDCPELKKEFYIENPEVAMMSAEEANAIRARSNNVIVVDLADGNNKRPTPNPCTCFEHAFEHYPGVLDEIYKQGFEKPSPIQQQMWPIALQGYDCIGIAQTGTGKTLAFLLPALIHIDNQSIPYEERGGANVLILSPTRELALQIQSEVRKYNYKGIRSCCLYGGGSRKEQISTVEDGVQIIIATPGRLNDLVNAGIVNVLSITFLVLDEADRMLDLGFEPQIMKILLDIRPDRQTIMTSATWPEGVRRLAKRYMTDPFQIYVGSLDLAACHTVTQMVEYIDEGDKRRRLTDFLLYERDPEEKCLVFVGRKATADDISSDFALTGIEAQCIHGDREQCDRELALQEFRDGTVKILIATDVASRGLDIPDISYVFNVDMPRCMEEYVHRVGRTGRAGRSGVAITLVTRQDWANAAPLIEILTEANQEVPQELHDMAQRFRAMKEREEREGFSSFRGRGRGGRFNRERRDDSFGFSLG